MCLQLLLAFVARIAALGVAGAPLWKILAAGEWRSPAFLDYLDVHRMEVELVLQGCLDEESDCDDGVS